MSDDAQRGDSLEQKAELAAARPLFHGVFSQYSTGDCLELSTEGTQALGLPREGYTYGETSLHAVWQLLGAVNLASYTCDCAPRATTVSAFERCAICGRRQAGATLVDLGSGIGNVVVGMALLIATGEARAASVHGVELLLTLHRAAVSALADLRARVAVDALLFPLPACELHCADLTTFDISDADVCYLCSASFLPSCLPHFAAHAARLLRTGSRVVSLTTPLRHPSFAIERSFQCAVSWGVDTAYVHLKLSPEKVCTLLAKGHVASGRSEWGFFEEPRNDAAGAIEKVVAAVATVATAAATVAAAAAAAVAAVATTATTATTAITATTATTATTAHILARLPWLVVSLASSSRSSTFPVPHALLVPCSMPSMTLL